MAPKAPMESPAASTKRQCPAGSVGAQDSVLCDPHASPLLGPCFPTSGIRFVPKAHGNAGIRDL